jgi:hypothetical protein
MTTRAISILAVLGVGIFACGARARDQSQLEGVWKLDRAATLQLQRDDRGKTTQAGECPPTRETPDTAAPDTAAPAPEPLPDFDFELQLLADGNAVVLTTVVGDKQRKLAKWTVARFDADGSGELDLLFARGLAKRCKFQLALDVLRLRAPGADHELVLRRMKPKAE